MKNNKNLQVSAFAKLTCSLMGHNYLISKKITNHINEYACCNCRKEVTDTVTGLVEPLTSKSKKLNEALQLFFNKKSQRSVA